MHQIGDFLERLSREIPMCSKKHRSHNPLNFIEIFPGCVVFVYGLPLPEARYNLAVSHFIVADAEKAERIGENSNLSNNIKELQVLI